MKYQPGQEVRPVQGLVRTMNPNRYCLGKVAVIVKAAGQVAGMTYYEIDVDGYIDYVDECNLEAV